MIPFRSVDEFKKLLKVVTILEEELKAHKQFLKLNKVPIYKKDKMEKIINSIEDKLKEQELEVSNMLERIDKLNYVRSDYRPLAMQRSKMIGMKEIASLLGIDTKSFSWIKNL